ncbi:unnamed protein product [Aureobasidium pullulans]|nr:unnamed protein product [Aureobasidium pullulans]
MALWRIFFNMAPHSLERMVQICTATWAARHVEEIHLPAGIDRSSGFQANSPARSSPRAVLKSICDALKIALQGLQRAQNYQVRVIVSQFNFPGYPRPRNLQRCVLEAMLESEYPLEQLHLLLELYPHKMWNWEIMPDGLPLRLGTTLKKLIVECKPPGIGEEHSTERSVFEDTALARTLDHSIRLEHLQPILDIWHRYREGFEEMQQFFEKVEKVQNFTLSQSLSIEEEFQNLNKR